MRFIPVLFIYTVLTAANLFGQNRLPKTLKQTVRYLYKDCPDDVKTKIKTIHKDSLIYAVYPFAKTRDHDNYKTIFNWTSDENGNPGIQRYLAKKGIYDCQSEVLLYSFRQYLLNGKINEKQLLNTYINHQKKMDEKNRIKFICDTINGVYIPKDLTDCFKQIDSFWNDSIKITIKNWTEDVFSSRAHLNFGMWMSIILPLIRSKI